MHLKTIQFAAEKISSLVHSEDMKTKLTQVRIVKDVYSDFDPGVLLAVAQIRNQVRDVVAMRPLVIGLSKYAVPVHVCNGEQDVLVVVVKPGTPVQSLKLMKSCVHL